MSAIHRALARPAWSVITGAAKYDIVQWVIRYGVAKNCQSVQNHRCASSCSDYYGILRTAIDLNINIDRITSLSKRVAEFLSMLSTTRGDRIHTKERTACNSRYRTLEPKREWPRFLCVWSRQFAHTTDHLNGRFERSVIWTTGLWNGRKECPAYANCINYLPTHALTHSCKPHARLWWID